MLKKLFVVFILFLITLSSGKHIFAQAVPRKELQTIEVSPTQVPSVSVPAPTSAVTPTTTPSSSASPSIAPSAPSAFLSPSDGVSPSPSPSISLSPSASPSVSPSPSISVSPSVTPTAVPTSKAPTPTLAPETKIATIAAAIKEAPIVKNISRVVSFPANFFMHTLPQEFYTSSSLSKKTTSLLLLLSLVFLIIGVCILKPGILTFIWTRYRGEGGSSVFEKRGDDLAGL